MSQYVVAATEDGLGCLLGWDPPLGTYFAQVYLVDDEGGRVDLYLDDDENEQSGTVLWVGHSPGEIRSVDELVGSLGELIEVPGNIKAALVADAA